MLLAVISVAVLVAAGCGGDSAKTASSSSPAPAANSSSDSDASSSEPDDAPGEAPQTTPVSMTYCSPGGTDLAMDLYLPTDTSKPVPVALYVHGGGWSSGSRKAGGFIGDMVTALTARGIAVAAIDYRLAPKFVFPAEIDDVTCAVRFLRTKASDLHIDPNHIGAWGGSAGGHLVSLLATIDASAGFDVGEFTDQSSRVQAVVDMFGPADLAKETQARQASGNVSKLDNVFGITASTPDPVAVAKQYSPITYVTPDDPPFLILQGDHDHTVPLAQSQELSDGLQAAGVSQQLVIVHGGPHGLGNPRETPPPSQLVQMMTDFFVQRLKG